MTGRIWSDYLLDLFRQFDLMTIFKHDPEVPDEADLHTRLSSYDYAPGAEQPLLKISSLQAAAQLYNYDPSP